MDNEYVVKYKQLVPWVQEASRVAPTKWQCYYKTYEVNPLKSREHFSTGCKWFNSFWDAGKKAGYKFQHPAPADPKAPIADKDFTTAWPEIKWVDKRINVRQLQ